MAEQFPQESLPGLGEPATPSVDLDALRNRAAEGGVAAARAYPYSEQLAKELRSAGFTKEEIDREITAHGARTADTSPLTRHRTLNTGPRLEDPKEDAVLQTQRGDTAGSAPTSSLTSEQKNANEKAFRAGHDQRSTAQIRDEGR